MLFLPLPIALDVFQGDTWQFALQMLQDDRTPYDLRGASAEFAVANLTTGVVATEGTSSGGQVIFDTPDGIVTCTLDQYATRPIAPGIYSVDCFVTLASGQRICAGVGKIWCRAAATPSDPIIPGNLLYNSTVVVDPAFNTRLANAPLCHVNGVGDFTESALADLTGALQTATGSPFVTTPTQAGSNAIFVVARATLANTSTYTAPSAVMAELAGLAGAPQRYLLHATSNELWIVSDGWRGAMHGLYDYLYRIGVRYLWPGDAWTDIPSLSDITLTAHAVVEPAFTAISWDPQYGYAAFGFHDATQKIAQGLHWYRWRRRNRVPIGYMTANYTAIVNPETQDLGGHVTSDFLTHERASMNGDSLNFAVVNGVRQDPATSLYINQSYHGSTIPSDPSGEDPNDYTSRAGLHALFSDYNNVKAGVWAAHRNDTMADPDATLVLSVWPNDGETICQCTKCVNMLRNGPYGLGPSAPDSSLSDRVFHVAAVQAGYLQAGYPNALIGCDIYNGGGALADHTSVPSIPVPPGVLLQAVLEVFSNGVLADVQLGRWAAKRDSPGNGFRLSVYEYVDLPANQGNGDPRLDPIQYRDKIAYWLTYNVDSLYCESTTCIGGDGQLWRLLLDTTWDTSTTAAGSLDAFWTRAFPSSSLRALARRSFDRWNSLGADLSAGYRRYSENPYEWGEWFNDLHSAEALAAGDSVAQKRLAILEAYALHCFYLYKTRVMPATQAAHELAIGNLLFNAYYTYATSVAHAAALFSQYFGDALTSQAFKDKWNSGVALVNGQDWQTRTVGTPPTDTQLIAYASAAVSALATAYPRLCATPSPLSNEFNLVAAGALSGSTTVVADNSSAATDWPDGPAEYVWISAGTGVVTWSGWCNGITADARLTLYKPDATTEVTVHELTGVSGTSPLTHAWDLSTMPTGVYRLKVESATALTFHKLSYPNNVPFARVGRCGRTMASFTSTPIYFWVPTGVTTFRVDASDPSQLGTVPVFKYGATTASASEVLNDDGAGSRTYIVTVPSGQSGQVWSVTNWIGTTFLIDLPNFFSRSAAQVVRPSERP